MENIVDGVHFFRKRGLTIEVQMMISQMSKDPRNKKIVVLKVESISEKGDSDKEAFGSESLMKIELKNLQPTSVNKVVLLVEVL
ncbi:unnamed protein product [Lactuca virosa]|uniref:Uncharacterized protein n=1 Tax=Lactuca virosa TaxID=75947 RepID=A0AAU9MET4_9ASTR|nr:unnamed protein product [Lactuca virosa]